MPREMPFSRLLPLALALALIGLTALWGGWLAAGSGSDGHWPFALSAALWPVLAWAGCRSRRRAAYAGRIQPRARTGHTPQAQSAQSAPPPVQARNSATPTSASAIAASPEAEREPTGERGPEFAGAFKR